MIKAILFDLDGVLANTEKLHYLAYRDVFDSLGYSFNKSDHINHWVHDGKSIKEFIQERQIPVDPSLVRAQKNKRFLELVSQTDIHYDGVTELVGELKLHYKLAVCTSSDKVAVHAILKKLLLDPCFDVIVTANDVVRRKPDPEGYLLAAQKLGVAPEACIIIEDAEKGVRAAQKAGMPVILINTSNIKEIQGVPVFSSIKLLSRQALEKIYDRHIQEGTG